MKPLPLPDLHHLRAAQGWFKLGNFQEANKELEKIAPALRVHADVLAARWEVYAMAGKWDACVDIAGSLTVLKPRSPEFWCKRATSLHRLGRTAEARDALLSAVDQAGEDSGVFYDLARYCCALGRVEEARAWLGKTFDLVGEAGVRQKLKLRAIEDGELKAVWSGGGEWAG